MLAIEDIGVGNFAKDKNPSLSSKKFIRNLFLDSGFAIAPARISSARGQEGHAAALFGFIIPNDLREIEKSIFHWSSPAVTTNRDVSGERLASVFDNNCSDKSLFGHWQRSLYSSSCNPSSLVNTVLAHALPHDGDLNDRDNGKDSRQKLHNPIFRRFVTAAVAFVASIIAVCWRPDWLICWSGVACTAGTYVLFLLSRWQRTWGWWW